MTKTSILRNLVCAATLGLLSAGTAHADLLWSDNFEYPLGDLKGNGTWFSNVPSTYSETIDLKDKALTYAGYQDNAVGNAIYLQKASDKSANIDYTVKCLETATKTGTLYTSFLFKVDELPAKGHGCFLSFSGPNYNGFNGQNRT